MAKITVGSHMPDFHYATPFQADRTIGETARRVSGKTAVVFLRFYGCALSQYDMREFARGYDRITETGGQLLVVLQSDPGKLARELTPDTFPFEIICDPEQKLYQDFEIAPAASRPAMVDAKTMEKIAVVERSDIKQGEPEGEALQLPATFVLTPDLAVTYAHYAKVIGDVPTAEELSDLLK